MSIRAIIICLIFINLLAIGCGPKPSAEKLPEYKSRAERYIDEGRYDKAINELHKVLKTDEKDAATYRKIAECFENLQQSDSAITYYEGAIVFNPADREAYERIGDIYFARIEPHEAMTWYERAQQIGYLSPESYINLGLIYQNWREYDQAKRYYEYAVAVDSSSGEALFGLAAIDLAEGDTVSALSMLARAYDFGVQAQAAFKLGQVYAYTKNYDDAIKWFDKCLIAIDIEADLKDRASQLRMEIIMRMKSGQE